MDRMFNVHSVHSSHFSSGFICGVKEGPFGEIVMESFEKVTRAHLLLGFCYVRMLKDISGSSKLIFSFSQEKFNENFKN